MNEEQTVGMRLRLIRKRHGLTQKQLGEKINVTSTNISRFENDGAHISIDLVMAICREFGVSLDYLYMGNTSDGLEDHFIMKNEKEFIIEERKIVKVIDGEKIRTYTTRENWKLSKKRLASNKTWMIVFGFLAGMCIALPFPFPYSYIKDAMLLLIGVLFYAFSRRKEIQGLGLELST